MLCCTLMYAPALASAQGVERFYELVRAVYELALPEVQRYEGTLAPLSGSSLTALFGVPVAQEDHAQRALLHRRLQQAELHRLKMRSQAWPGRGSPQDQTGMFHAPASMAATSGICVPLCATLAL